jgi:hypothetical protein
MRVHCSAAGSVGNGAVQGPLSGAHSRAQTLRGTSSPLDPSVTPICNWALVTGPSFAVVHVSWSLPLPMKGAAECPVMTLTGHPTFALRVDWVPVATPSRGNSGAPPRAAWAKAAREPDVLI